MANPIINDKGIVYLGWTSLALAVIGGCAMTASFLGHWIAAIVGVGPDWLAPLLGVVLGVAAILDILLDGTPNRPAIWTAILLPSIAQSINGKGGQTIQQWAADLNAYSSAKLGEWLGQGSLTALALIATGVALVLARRVIAKTRAGQRGGNVPAGVRG
ncbi:hypothetical protein [Dactylosporangium sp. CA-139066]|uniref:hypothetical protein n=1 Tax=Dactylosporangium sp. CA-139066 TaxID=3239930 RepID=UPI003D94C3CF